MERMLRLPDTVHKQSPVVQDDGPKETPLLRVDPSLAIKATVDDLFVLQKELSEKMAAFNKEVAPLKKKIKEATMAVEEYARTNKQHSLVGNSAVAKFTPDITRKVDVRKLLAFLNATGKVDSFWGYLSATIKAVTKDFGERVLEAEGVIISEKDDFGTMTIEARD